jgi:hypothetical protein
MAEAELREVGSMLAFDLEDEGGEGSGIVLLRNGGTGISGVGGGGAITAEETGGGNFDVGGAGDSDLVVEGVGSSPRWKSALGPEGPAG